MTVRLLNYVMGSLVFTANVVNKLGKGGVLKKNVSVVSGDIKVFVLPAVDSVMCRLVNVLFVVLFYMNGSACMFVVLVGLFMNILGDGRSDFVDNFWLVNCVFINVLVVNCLIGSIIVVLWLVSGVIVMNRIQCCQIVAKRSWQTI